MKRTPSDRQNAFLSVRWGEYLTQNAAVLLYRTAAQILRQLGKDVTQIIMENQIGVSVIGSFIPDVPQSQ